MASEFTADMAPTDLDSIDERNKLEVPTQETLQSLYGRMKWFATSNDDSDLFGRYPIVEDGSFYFDIRIHYIPYMDSQTRMRHGATLTAKERDVERPESPVYELWYDADSQFELRNATEMTTCTEHQALKLLACFTPSDGEDNAA